jgi:hypothetical protein
LFTVGVIAEGKSTGFSMTKMQERAQRHIA